MESKKTEKSVKDMYAKEPWGKLLLEMGREPYDTESSARRVAEYAAEKIEKLEKLVELGSEVVDYSSYAEIVGGISVNNDPIRKFCDEFSEAQREYRKKYI